MSEISRRDFDQLGSNGRFSELFRIFRTEWTPMLQALCLAAIGSLLTFGGALLIQLVVDRAIPVGSPALLAAIGVGMLIIAGVRVIVSYIQYILCFSVAQRMDYRLVFGVYGHLLRLPHSFYTGIRTGELSARIRETGKVRAFLSTTLLSVAYSVLTLIFCLLLMAVHSSRLALLSAFLIPILASLYWLADRSNRHFQRMIAEDAADIEAHWIESLQAVSLVRQFGLHSRMTLSAETKMMKYFSSSWLAGVRNTLTANCVALVTAGYATAIVWYGGGLVLQSVMSPGELVSCFTMSAALASPIGTLVNSNASFREAFVAVRRLNELLSVPSEKVEGVSTGSLQGQDIEFRDISFGYLEGSPILKGVSFSIKAGAINLIRGPSGAGKSTIANLLLRNYEDFSGAISIGGANILNFSIDSYRRKISVVHQNPVFLTASVFENVTIGAAGGGQRSTFDSISRKLLTRDFIDALPLGENTVLKENAATLSGGQRQRLAIMRCLCCSSDILVLDEPSNNLDTLCERALYSCLRDEARAGKTVVLISHSSTAIEWADFVLEVADGAVVPYSIQDSIAASPRHASETPLSASRSIS